MPRRIWALTRADANGLIEQAIGMAERQGLAIAVAVVEAGGITIGLSRMDEAKLVTVAAAERKAWTAALFRRASGDYAGPTAPGGESYGLLNAFPGRLLPSPGGRPIVVEGECIGGIGISGASSTEDEALAVAAVAAFMTTTG